MEGQWGGDSGEGGGDWEGRGDSGEDDIPSAPWPFDFLIGPPALVELFSARTAPYAGVVTLLSPPPAPAAASLQSPDDVSPVRETCYLIKILTSSPGLTFSDAFAASSASLNFCRVPIMKPNMRLFLQGTCDMHVTCM